MTAVEQYRPQAAEVATFDPTGGRLVAWAQAASAANQLATSLSRTSFVPKAFQGNAGDATAAIILGDELGLSPLSALRSIYIISGTPALYARTMVALAMAHGHDVWTELSTDAEVVVCGQRKGSEHVERSSWTTARARKAGYTNNKKYDTDPQAMLYSKAAAEIARKIAPDVLSGVPYSVEDLELDEPAPTTAVQRRATKRTAAPVVAEPGFDEPPVSTVSPDAEPVATILPVDPPVLPATTAQVQKLNILMQEHDVTDRDSKLAYLSERVGRPLASSKELSKEEASRLIDGLEQLAGPIEDEPTDEGQQRSAHDH